MRQKFERGLAWAIVITLELVAAAIPPGILAAITVPLAYRRRGEFAIGGEWLLIGLVFCLMFAAIHTYISRRAGRTRRT